MEINKKNFDNLLNGANEFKPIAEAYDPDKSIVVSIICNTFNHEKYIAKCLDGFLMQKVNFNVEVLVHDDASTDNTQEIIKKYAKKYPNIIKPIYQDKNQYSQGIKFAFLYQYPRVKGKYVAFCEGDDFWDNDYKLIMQYTGLEYNRDCSICTTLVRTCDNYGNILKESIPDLKLYSGKIVQKKFAKYLFKNPYIFQTSSYFLRKEVLDFKSNNDLFSLVNGDWGLLESALFLGNCFYINIPCSVYQKNTIGGWNYRERTIGVSKKLKYFDNNILNHERFNQLTNYKYNKYVKYHIKKTKSMILSFLSDRNITLLKEYKKKYHVKFLWIINTRGIKIFFKILLAYYFPGLFKKIQNKRYNLKEDLTK